MNRLLGICLLLPCLTLPACVTINIYFPAAAAEQAADRIIDEVWQMRGAGQPAPAAAPKENAP